MPDPSEVLEAGKQVARDFSEKNVTFMAAGIAYNALVSLAPLLVLLLLVVSVLGAGLEERLVSAARNSLPGPIADVVVRVFSGERAAASASVVGFVVLVWGTLKIFRGLDTAFSEIYETERNNSLVDQFVDGLVVLVALLFSIVATVAVSAVFSTLSEEVPFVGLLTPVVLVVGLVVAFLPMYFRFPDTDLGWKDTLPGAVFAALGWAALQAAFQVYLVFRSGGYESFFGGVLVVVAWLYFSGLVLLLGAVLNAVIGGHSTGAPGGVGRGAARDGSVVESRRSMDREELAAYLRELRTQLTGHYAEMDPVAGPIESGGRPEDDVEMSELVGTLRKFRPASGPDAEVEVIERSGDDGRERTVVLRWRPAGRDPEE